MTVLPGTSGYAFKEWKGTFYPEDIKPDGMLGYYATRFPTVEINNTFYRLPKESVIIDWASQVPDRFTFAVKASMRITHHARLKPESAETVQYLLKNTAALGPKLGPILFQLPPNLKKDADRLRAFLTMLPDDRRYTIEFRHETWYDDEVYDALRARDVALCIIDQEDFAAPMISTASWGYVRLHRFDYNDFALGEWVKRIAAQSWSTTFVYFKHDEGAGSGPTAVAEFTRQLTAGKKSADR
jgi:uncharacterized protein YecE (DUF72 family)